MVANVVTVLAIFSSWVGVTPTNLRQDKSVTVSSPKPGAPMYAKSHALIVGINQYQHLPSSLQLRYARADAAAVKAILTESFGFAEANVHPLFDGLATAAAIKRELSKLADRKVVGPNDRIVVFFSGHGQRVNLPNGGEAGFFIPADAKVDMADPDNAAPYLETAIQMDDVWRYLGASPAKHVLVIADACFSGLFAANRNISGVDAKTAGDLLGRRARQMLSAGAKDQTAKEKPELGHGVLTYAILQELKAQTEGKPFTANQLLGAVEKEVARQSESSQFPSIHSIDGEGQVLFVRGTNQSLGEADLSRPISATAGSSDKIGASGQSRMLEDWLRTLAETADLVETRNVDRAKLFNERLRAPVDGWKLFTYGEASDGGVRMGATMLRGYEESRAAAHELRGWQPYIAGGKFKDAGTAEDILTGVLGKPMTMPKTVEVPNPGVGGLLKPMKEVDISHVRIWKRNGCIFALCYDNLFFFWS